MEPTIKGTRDDHIEPIDYWFGASIPKQSRDVSDLPILQYLVGNQDHDGPDDKEPHPQGCPIELMHCSAMNMDIQQASLDH